MHIDYFKQRQPGRISVGDEIALYADKDDFLESGRYQVFRLQQDDAGALTITLAGMGPLQGTICSIDL